jgi:hypothetical protein
MPNEPVKPSCAVLASDPAHLSNLWPRGAAAAVNSDDPTWLPSDLAAILRHQLLVPVDAKQPSCGELLAGPNPALEDLRRLKDWAKENMTRDDGDVPREIAGALYFAAIYAARLRLGQRITELTEERLIAAANWALQLSWLDPLLAGLFREGMKQLNASPAEC